MPENSVPYPTRRDAWRHDRAGAIARTLVAIAAGIAVGICQRDIPLGITTATGCLNLLKAACTKKAH